MFHHVHVYSNLYLFQCTQNKFYKKETMVLFVILKGSADVFRRWLLSSSLKCSPATAVAQWIAHWILCNRRSFPFPPLAVF